MVSDGPRENASWRARTMKRTEFLRKRGFGMSETAKIIETVLCEEGRKPERYLTAFQMDAANTPRF